MSSGPATAQHDADITNHKVNEPVIAPGARRAASRGAVVLALTLVYICWGSTYLAIRFAVETLPPFLMSGLRFLVAGVMMYGWAMFRTEERPTLLQWRSAAIVAAFLFLGGNGLVVWSEQFVPSGVVALVIGITPLWILMIAWFWGDGGGTPNLKTMLGMATGFLGLFVLIGPRAAGNESYDARGIVAVILATIFWAFGSIFSRKSKHVPKSFPLVAGMQMISGGIILMVVGFLLGEGGRANLDAMSVKSLASFVYLVFFGSVIGYSSYAYVLQVTTPAVASTYAFVNPVVAVVLGWALADEAITTRTLVAMALIIAAVAGISLGRASDKK